MAPNSPAQRAGLVPRDVIVALDGQRLESAEALIEAVRARRPGQEVTVRVRRVVSLALDGDKRTSDGRLALGAYLNDDPESVTVARLAPDHPAAAAGLRPGDRIVALDRVAVQREAELAERMRAIGAPRTIELTVERELSVRLAEAPGAGPEPTVAPLAESQQALIEQVRALRNEIEQLRDELERLRRELARSRAR